MPVPSSIADLSQTAGDNYPTSAESPTTADDYFRTYASYIAMLRDGKGFTDPVQFASAATTDIGGQNAMFVEITGTTTITSFGTNYNGPRFLRFTGALTLTHNATTLNLPGGASITTAAGDTAIAVPNFAGNGWNVHDYRRTSNATAFNDIKQAATDTATGVVELATTAEAIAGTDTSRAITPSTLFGGLNASGSAPIYAARAWVNYKGTATVGIRASGNVSSVTVNGTGDFTVNFSTSLPDANYGVALAYAPTLGGIAAASRVVYLHTLASSSCRFQCRDNAAALADFEHISLSFHR